MRTLLRFNAITILWIVFAVGTAEAAPFAFGVETSGTVYSVDLGTATKTLVGPTGVSFEALALSPAGELFGTDVPGNLYRVNTLTGTATLIGSTGRGNIEGLDFNGSTLLGITFTNTPTIFSINTATAGTTNIITATNASGVVRSMATLDSNTMLLADDINTTTVLESINLTTGVRSTLGNMGSGAQFILAIDFATDGNLYALNRSGNEYIVNPTNAALTLVGNTGGDFWLGMAAAPGQPSAVPEPGTLLLLGSGLSSIAVATWRKRRHP